MRYIVKGKFKSPIGDEFYYKEFNSKTALLKELNEVLSNLSGLVFTMEVRVK